MTTNLRLHHSNLQYPQFVGARPPPTPLTPASPRNWFGSQVIANSDNLPRPRTPTTPCWVYQSSGLYSEKKAQSCYSPLTVFQYPSQSEEFLSQDDFNSGVLHGGSPWCNLQQSTHTAGPCKENVHPGGGSRKSDDPQFRGPILADVNNNFTSDIKATGDIKIIQPISEENNTHFGQLKRSDNEVFIYRPEKSGGDGVVYARKKRYARSLRKRYSSGISAKDLKLFTKAIGFKSCTDGSHNYICELLDFVIDSKRVYRASTCPRGSKFLQHQIINANWADRNDILEQVMEKLVTICNENYGNYVVQCFFMLSNPEIERKILLRMKGSLCLVAMDQYGCRVLQKAIPTLNDELLRIVIDAIAPKTYALAVHNFGCHVLQRAIERGTGQVVRVLLSNAIRGRRRYRLVELARNSFGCRIIQRMLEKAFPVDRVTIIQAIMGTPRDLLMLCMDEFGNYVVQHIVDHFQAEHSMAVMDVLDKRLLKMAKNKFCSNVLEVLYKRGGREVEDRLIQQVDLRFLKECLNDKFANYLVQTMLMEGEPENRVKIRLLLQNIPDLKELKFGKFVIYRLCRLNRTLAREDRGIYSLEE